MNQTTPPNKPARLLFGAALLFTLQAHAAEPAAETSGLPTAMQEALASPQSVTELGSWSFEVTASELPDSIGEMTNLQSLRLEAPNLETLPSSIGKLQNLQKLSLYGGNRENHDRNVPNAPKFTHFPESLGDLKHLRELTVYGMPLASLPESFGKLQEVRRVFIAHCDLVGLPESIGGCERLEFLKLPDNPLRSLPESLGELPSLRYLDLGGPNTSLLTSLPSNFGDLDRLEFLSFAGPLESWPHSMERLSAIRAMHVGYGKFSRFPRLNAARQLRDLQLSRSENLETLDLDFSDHPQLTLLQVMQSPRLSNVPANPGAATNLRVLDLEDAGLTELPAALSEGKKLAFLRLPESLDGWMAEHFPTWVKRSPTNPKWRHGEDGAWCPPSIPDPFLLYEIVQRNLLSRERDVFPGYDDGLSTLDLSGQGWSGIFTLRFSHAKAPEALRALDLSGNQITELDREAFGKFINLEQLDLRGNPLREGELEAIAKLLPTARLMTGSLPDQADPLTELEVRGIMLASVGSELASPNTIRSVSLDYNEITRLPEWLFALANVETLRLGVNRLANLPASVAQLKALQALDLGCNLLTTLPPELGTLQQLETLDLSLNEFTEIPDVLTSLTSLRQLDLSGNPLPAEEVTRLQQALPDTQIHF